MGIPAILSYPMPTSTDVPESVAGWRPDPRRAALLIHDMQNYFVDFFPSGQSPVVELLANVVALRRAAVAHRIPVIYSAQPGPMTPRERGLLLDVWGPGMSADDRARRIVAPLAPAPGERVVTKRRYSAFHGTGLRSLLQHLGRDQLIVCGVYAHIGCLTTATDAFSYDIEAFLVVDAVADFTPEYHRMALRYAAQRCAVTLTADEVLDDLRRQPEITAGRADLRTR